MKRNPYKEISKELKSKTNFYLENKKTGKSIKIREVFRNKNLLIHYPFRKDGSPKYRSIKSIIYEDMPKTLPRGFIKDSSIGYGFTKVYNPIIYLLEEKLDPLKKIIISPSKENEFSKGTVILNARKLDQKYPVIKLMLDKQKEEKEVIVSQVTYDLFPNSFTKPKGKYTKGSLSTFIKSKINSSNDLSKEDVDSIFDLIDESEKFYDRTRILKTREKFDQFFIEDIIAEFEKLLFLKDDSTALEDKWQNFFFTNSWIFSQLFSFPVLLHEGKAYIGGKTIANDDGKIADFLYKNSLTDNIAIIEIKTHKTKLFRKNPYRGDDVFAISEDFSGGVGQVLNQKDNLQKTFYTLKGTSKKNFESYNSKCILIIGSIKDKSEEQRKAFELYRSNSRDVEIITFDELLERLKGLKELFGESK